MVCFSNQHFSGIEMEENIIVAVVTSQSRVILHPRNVNHNVVSWHVWLTLRVNFLVNISSKCTATCPQRRSLKPWLNRTALFLWWCLTALCLRLPPTDLLLPENRRRLPLEEQLHYLQARYDEVSSGKHSIGQSRRAKALRKEMAVIKRKLAHQREGGSGMGARDSVGGGDRGSFLPHHPSSTGRHDEGGESSSQEIGGKGQSRNML